MKLTNLIKTLLASATILVSASSFAADIDMNADKHNVSIKGYDTVAYFTEGKAVRGNANFTATYKNTTFHFSSAENRDLFNSDKDKYAPQYGGFCAMGVAMNQKFDVDPQAWKIVDDKLYLNYNKDVQKAWLKDVPGNLKTAEQNWPELKGLTPEEAQAKNG